MELFHKRGKRIVKKGLSKLIGEVSIYGFGSYFANASIYNDIDVLIIHRDSSPESCQFAIKCKRYFLSNINDIDVTILSQSEERGMSFILKSKSRYLGAVNLLSLERDLDKILKMILATRI